MRTETLTMILNLLLRSAEVWLNQTRRATQKVARKAETRVDRLVARVAPAAEKVLSRAAPRAVQKARRRRRRSALGLATTTFLGAAAASVAAYIAVKEQNRIRDRYRPTRSSFPTDLLEVLSAPGGGGRLEYAGNQLVDARSGAVYTIIDGIPDFIAPATPGSDQPESEETWVVDLVRPVLMQVLGRNSAGNAAFASAVAGSAGEGWAVSVPSGRGTYELVMAQANPRARVLCVSNDWDTLLEVRRRAAEAGVKNLYYARGLPRLLPLQDGSAAGVWSAGGLDRFPEPERELTQMARVARPGALMAGVSLVRGGPRQLDAVLALGQRRLRGVRALPAHFALLQASGLQDVRVFRDGAFVRFTGVRAG